MAAPALQKTWQGGTTLGGVELVNVSINEASSELTARATLLAIKQALTTFNLNPWTVVGSSDSVAASMDATDRWADISDLVYRTTGGTAFSWIVLQQGNIAANCQILLALENTLSSDPNRQDLTIQAVVGSGFTGGSITVLPTAAGMISINALTSPWLGSMTTGTKIVLSCIESDDGQCTRIIASNDTNGIPFTCLGFERPRLPNSNWVNPSCFYLLGETIASGLSCFRWETMQDTEPFLAVVKDHNNADLQVAMRMAGPMIVTTEAVDWTADGLVNPAAWAGTLIHDGKDADFDWGTLFDWYWVNRDVGGAHMLDLDTAPAAASPATAASFPNDTTSPNSMALVASPASGMRISGDISIELWVHPLGWAGAGNRQPVVKRNNGSSVNYGLGVVAPGTQIEFQYATTGGGTTRFHNRPASVPVSTWTHLAATRDLATGTTKLFVNGVQAGADLVQDAGSFNDLVTGTAYIGGTTSAITDFYGYACEYRLWNIIRTPAEILANYNQELVGNEAGLVCYLPLVTDFLDATANSNDFTPTAGAGQPAPSIEAIARPFGLAAVPPRAFVCVGDCMWGWLNDSATNLEYTIFNWSGAFDIMPQNPTDARTMLGIDGSLTTDLGDNSHFWRIKSIATPDLGTLYPGGNTSNLYAAAGTPTYALDADYELGAVGKEVFVIDGDTDSQRDYASQAIPNPQDGTKSFLMGVSFTPSAGNDGRPETSRSVYHAYDNGGAKGFYLWYQNDGAGNGVGRQLILSTIWSGANSSVGSSLVFAYDIPVYALFVLDFAESKLKLIVAQGATIQYDEAALADTGNFTSLSQKSFGDPVSITNWGASWGKIAQGYTFEWAAATPSGITAANVKRYLKYTDGVLP